MKKLIAIICCMLVVFTACKDKTEDENPIDNPDIIGTWKRVASGTIFGSDTDYTNYSENIYHKFFENNTYEEHKTSSGFTSVAHYTFGLSNDTLKFYSMGSVLDHKNFCRLSSSTLIIHVPPDAQNHVYKLTKMN